jgi:hypothetical protein
VNPPRTVAGVLGDNGVLCSTARKVPTTEGTGRPHARSYFTHTHYRYYIVHELVESEFVGF